MSSIEVTRILYELLGPSPKARKLDLSFKQREALAWAIAKLT